MKENGCDPKNGIVFVIGNKSDLKSKEIEPNEITNYVKKRGYEYYATSASSGDNVNEVFLIYKFLGF